MRIITVIFIAFLVGCNTLVDDWMGNDFPSVVAYPAPEVMVGIWVGSVAYYLVSLDIQKDGLGLSC